MPPWSAWQKHPPPKLIPACPTGAAETRPLQSRTLQGRTEEGLRRAVVQGPRGCTWGVCNSLLPSEPPHFFHTCTPFPSYCWAVSGKEGTEEKWQGGWVIANGPCFGVSPSKASRSEELPGDSVQQRVVPKAPGFNREGSGKESPWRKALCQREPGKRRPTILATSPSPDDHENLPLKRTGTESCTRSSFVGGS